MISRADLALIAVSLLWGGTFVVVKDALNDVSTFLFLALRFTLAAGVLAMALGRRLASGMEGPAALRQEWRGGVVCAALLFFGYAFQTAGLKLTTASRSAFLTALYIALVPLLASFVNDSRPRPAEIAGILLAGCGTALLTAASGGWQAQGWDLNRGDMLTILSALAFAGHILTVTHFSRRMAYERLALYQIGGVALFSWLALRPMETPRIVWSAGVIASIAATAVLATSAAFLIYTWAQQRTTPTRAALIFASEPVFAGLIAWLWAGEAWTTSGVAGAGLILSGIVLVEVKPSNGTPHQED